ncbi:MAG: VOC family protein [Thermodesulfobacteriota bacterium]
MKIEKVDHISFAVKDLEATKKVYKEDLGLEPAYEYVAPSEKIKVARYFIGEVAVELMESTAPDGEVAKFIAGKGEGVFLISYRVADLAQAMQELQEKHVQLIDSKPREIFGTKYAFIHHPDKLSGVLTELIEGDFDINK